MALLPFMVLAAGLFTAGSASSQPASSGAAAGPSSVQAIRLASERQEILINLTGGLPGRWQSCATGCAGDAAGHRPEWQMTFLRASAGGGRLEWHVEGDPGATRGLATVAYTASAEPTDDGAVVILTSVEPWQGIRPCTATGWLPGAIRWKPLQVPAGAQLRLTGGEDLVPERLPGFGSYHSHVRAVRPAADGQSVLADDDANPRLAPPPGEWAGLRSRFWALLVTSGGTRRSRRGMSAPERPQLVIGDASSAGRVLDLKFYAGPVERSALTAAAPELKGLLYPALWDWLRALSFGLLWLYEFWQRPVE